MIEQPAEAKSGTYKPNSIVTDFGIFQIPDDMPEGIRWRVDGRPDARFYAGKKVRGFIEATLDEAQRRWLAGMETSETILTWAEFEKNWQL